VIVRRFTDHRPRRQVHAVLALVWHRSPLPADQLPAPPQVDPDLGVPDFPQLLASIVITRSPGDNRRIRILPDLEVISRDPVDGKLAGLQNVQPTLLVNEPTVSVGG